MASVKLVNGNPLYLHHHSSLYGHHHHPHPFLQPPLHLDNPRSRSPSPSSSPSSSSSASPVAQSHHNQPEPPTTPTPTPTAGMTLDYTLPNRTRLGDPTDRQIKLNLTTTTSHNINDDGISPSDTHSTTNYGSDSNGNTHTNSRQGYNTSSYSKNKDTMNISTPHIANPSSIPASPSPHYPLHQQQHPQSESPGPTRSRLSAPTEHPDTQTLLDTNSSTTPTKKNKRKLSEPRKVRPDLDSNESAEPGSTSSQQSPHTSGDPHSPAATHSDDNEDEDRQPAIKIPKYSSKAHLRPDQISAIDLHNKPMNCSSNPSKPTPKHKSPSSSRKNKKSSHSSSSSLLTEQLASSSSTPPPSASSSSPSSSSSPHVITHAHTSQPENENAGIHDRPASSSSQPSSAALPNGLPHPPFIHPFLSAVPPAAFGLVPGLYLPGQPFPPQSLPPTFPGIPLHLQQSYFAAAAAAAAAAQSSGSATCSTSTPPLLPTPSSTTAASSSSTAKPATISSEASSSQFESSSQLYKHREPPSSTSSSSLSSHPVILQPPQLPHLNNGKHTPTQSRILQPPQPSSSSTSATPSSSHFTHREPQPSSSSLDHQQQLNDEDDDDDLASSNHSPEDLSLGGSKMSRKHRKNYKNMTRERRVEANARERTRVHTISAAFDALRRAVPSYSYNQKLSKLAILRIACSYIMSLARLADLDYTSANEHIQQPLSFAECVDMCTSTIQTEGRARRRH